MVKKMVRKAFGSIILVGIVVYVFRDAFLYRDPELMYVVVATLAASILILGPPRHWW